MFRWKTWLPLFLLLIVGASYALPKLMHSGSEHLGYTCLRPSEWLQRFYTAVDRGELSLFMTVLTREQIIPRDVEQHYVLESGVYNIIIHADLVEPQDFPGDDSIEVRGISSELDMSGHIIETRLHVYAKPGAEQND